ncbi:MAG: chorismate synthase [Ferruginibacter sp.]|nr:chorismate synthase [Ferruginibacter sp.]
MNSFGTLLRIHIFGESHGPSVGITIDGCPAGIPVPQADFLPDLERRKGGMQKGTTPRKEDDLPIFISGVFNERTTGAPLTMLFENNNTRSTDYDKLRSVPRPGHADFTASQKFGGYEDFRGGGHFSGRLTVCLVAAGIIAKKIMQVASGKISCVATIKEIGGEPDTEKGLQKAIDAKDSVGGIVECVTKNLPAGLGEPFFHSAESLISQLAFAIPAIKGIEFGAGFAAAKMFGTEHNDALLDASGTTATNHAGGIVGGITNGNDLIFRVAVKPTSSTPKEQQTYNLDTDKIEAFSVKGRHDLCIALRVPVILEAVTALVLADLLLLEQKVPRITQ